MVLSAFAAVKHLELVAGIGREKRGDVPQALGECGRGQQRVLTLAQVMVVEVDRKRKHVNGERVRERRLEETHAGSFVNTRAGDLRTGVGLLGAAARFPCILAGFAAHLCLSLRPGESREAIGNARGLDKIMRHIDEELEGEAEAVFNETRGDEDGLRIAEGSVAMADGAVAQFNRVGGRDEIFAGVGNGEWNKVVSSLAQRGSQPGRYGTYQALKVRVGDASFAEGCVADAVRRILHRRLRGNFLGMPQLDLCAASHKFVF